MLYEPGGGFLCKKSKQVRGEAHGRDLLNRGAIFILLFF